MEIQACFVAPLVLLGCIGTILLLCYSPEFGRGLRRMVRKIGDGKFFGYIAQLPLAAYVATIYLASFLLVFALWPNHIDVVACGEQPKTEKQMLSKQQTQQLSSGMIAVADTCPSQNLRNISF